MWKKKGKNKKQKKRRIKPRERNFVHRIYYLFIYLFAVNGNGRGERDAIAGSTMQRGREIGCCFCTPLFLSLKFHFIDVHAPLLSLPLEFLSRVVIPTIFGWYFSSSTFIYYSTSNSIAIFFIHHWNLFQYLHEKTSIKINKIYIYFSLPPFSLYIPYQSLIHCIHAASFLHMHVSFDRKRINDLLLTRALHIHPLHNWHGLSMDDLRVAAKRERGAS